MPHAGPARPNPPTKGGCGLMIMRLGTVAASVAVAVVAWVRW